MGNYDAYQLSVRDSTEFMVEESSTSSGSSLDSHYSEATVSIYTTSGSTINPIMISCPTVNTDGTNNMFGESSYTASAYIIASSDPATMDLNVLMRDNLAYMTIYQSNMQSFTSTCTGDVQFIDNVMLPGVSVFAVAGAGTITISNSSGNQQNV